jgi:hypothetical protein
MSLAKKKKIHKKLVVPNNGLNFFYLTSKNVLGFGSLNFVRSWNENEKKYMIVNIKIIQAKYGITF